MAVLITMEVSTDENENTKKGGLIYFAHRYTYQEIRIFRNQRCYIKTLYFVLETLEGSM